MHSMRLGLALGFEFGLGFDFVYGLGLSIGLRLRFGFGLGLQLWLRTLPLYVGSAFCSWPLLDLSLGFAWGLASNGATALAWS